MSEFDDPDLRHQLGRLSGPYPDDNAAFAAWQRRVGQARRRRAMAWTTGAALSLIVGTVAVAAVQNPTQHSVVPQKSSETSTRFSVTVASTMTAATDPSTTASTVPVTTAATTLAPETTPAPSVVETPVPEVAGDDGSGVQGDEGSSTGRSAAPTSAAKPSKSATQSFDSPGGSIAVRIDGDDLALVATNPAAGFRVRENDRSGRKVEVTFRSDDEAFEVTVRLSDGVMKATVVDKSDRHRDTVPDDTFDGGHGGGGGGGSSGSGGGGGGYGD